MAEAVPCHSALGEHSATTASAHRGARASAGVYKPELGTSTNSTAGTSSTFLRSAYSPFSSARSLFCYSSLSSIFSQTLTTTVTHAPYILIIMKFSTIFFVAAAAVSSVYAAPSAIKARDVNPALVPDFGVVAGTGADGTG